MDGLEVLGTYLERRMHRQSMSPTVRLCSEYAFLREISQIWGARLNSGRVYLETKTSFIQNTTVAPSDEDAQELADSWVRRSPA